VESQSESLPAAHQAEADTCGKGHGKSVNRQGQRDKYNSQQIHPVLIYQSNIADKSLSPKRSPAPEMMIEQAREVLKIEAEGILAIRDQVGPDFDKSINMIMKCPSRVILAGIGKSGIIGQKIAATLNSTGTASFFLHPVEAMHGDLGIVDSRDVVLAISYSGETAELNLLVNSLKNRAVPIIAMTGDPESTLAKLADAVLNVAVPREACPLGLAPTSSTTGALAMGDALAVVLLDRKQFKECDFRRNHPGGSLGERLKVNVSEVMLTGEHIPMIEENISLREAVAILNAKNLGAVLIVD
jgi:arabinose-5-phosphate isomerase